MISQKRCRSMIAQEDKVRVGDEDAANHDLELGTLNLKFNLEKLETRLEFECKCNEPSLSNPKLVSSLLVSDFLEEVNDDILFEIFLRLPNCRSAILCGSVCHYWHSLISRPQFIPRFTSQHREHGNRYPRPYTIILRKRDRIGLGLDNYRPICKLFSEESLFLHGKSARTSYLDFLPCPMVIRASCNDLLLVYPTARSYLGLGSGLSDDLYICNPITKQFYQLPEFARPSRWYRVTGHALVCMTTELGLSTNHFKVVEFYDFGPRDIDTDEPTSHVMSIFCSESGKWGRECFHWPRPNPNGFRDFNIAKEMEEVVTCNGIAYWLEKEGDVDRVIALDLWKSECRVIVFPDDFWWFRGLQYADVRGQIGAVCGELRLLQIVLTGAESTVDLRVWKLSFNSKEWVLVHDKKILRRPSNEEVEFIAAFVHPTNGDVVFMAWDQNVFQYNLIVGDVIDEIEEYIPLERRYYVQADQYDDNGLVPFPMVHPAWPTPLPSV